MDLSADDAGRLREVRLARIKRVATGLLVLAALGYALARAFEPRYPGLSWVSAACEAAMVGALADWFAVVALFRQPLGLPLPHTAIIPRNKARIAQGLGEFIQEKFLSTEALVARIRELDPARQLSAWLLTPANANFIADYAARALAFGLEAIADERVRGFLERSLSAQLRRLDVSTFLARLLEILTANRRHHALLDQTIAALHELLSREETREFLRREIAAQMPMLRWVNQVVHLDERAAAKLIEVALERLSEVLRDPDHELRHRFDTLVERFIRNLEQDPATRERVDALKEDLLANPKLADYVGSLWQDLRRWVEADLAHPGSTLRARLAQFARSLGTRLEADERMREWINESVIAGVPPLVAEHRGAVGRFIERQINDWQDATLVRELERHIGPDLQFIRINGTLVGGMVGLLLFGINRLLLV